MFIFGELEGNGSFMWEVRGMGLHQEAEASGEGMKPVRKQSLTLSSHCALLKVIETKLKSLFCRDLQKVERFQEVKWMQTISVRFPVTGSPTRVERQVLNLLQRRATRKTRACVLTESFFVLPG